MACIANCPKWSLSLNSVILTNIYSKVSEVSPPKLHSSELKKKSIQSISPHFLVNKLYLGNYFLHYQYLRLEMCIGELRMSG